MQVPEFDTVHLLPWSSSNNLNPQPAPSELWDNFISPTSPSPSPLVEMSFQPPTGPFVPLLMAVPRANTSVTSQQEFLECPSIEFIADGQQGIRLLDALQGDLTALQDGDDEVMHASSAKVSYRVEWPGYRPFTRQKYARRVKGLQNRAKIAKQVAEVVGEFVNAQSRYVPSQAEWRVGRGFIEYSHLYLLEIRRISRSTWVPVLAYAV